MVGVSDMGAKIERAMRRAEKMKKKQLTADAEDIERDAKRRTLRASRRLSQRGAGAG